MEKETNTEKLLQNVDKTSSNHDEELAFIAYQENITKAKEEKRTRILLITLSVAVYLLGLGLFAVIVQTIYNMNHIAGIIVGCILLVLYTICFILVLVSIFSKHSFDLEYDRKRKGKIPERTNNKVRWEIARNIKDQSVVLDYIDKAVNKTFLSKEEAKKADAFLLIQAYAEQYPDSTPSSKSEPSIKLAGALSLSMKKDGVIYKKAKSLIMKRAVSTGCLTALSQNAVVDAGVVAVKNVQLVKDIIWLYGFRPTNGEMTKILSMVVRNVCVSIGLNSMPKSANIASKIFNKDSNSFLIQLLGQAIDMGAQFLGNGVMTYLVGKYTVSALLSQYRIQELYRLEDLKDYEMEMSSSTIHEINEEVEEEVKEIGNDTMKEKKEEPLLIEDKEEKKHWSFPFFHRKKKQKTEFDH